MGLPLALFCNYWQTIKAVYLSNDYKQLSLKCFLQGIVVALIWFKTAATPIFIHTNPANQNNGFYTPLGSMKWKFTFIFQLKSIKIRDYNYRVHTHCFLTSYFCSHLHCCAKKATQYKNYQLKVTLITNPQTLALEMIAWFCSSECFPFPAQNDLHRCFFPVCDRLHGSPFCLGFYLKASGKVKP